LISVLTAFQQAPVSSAVVKEDEAAAMAAIFSAQTQNWEETQEKMSQLVYPKRAFCSSEDSLMNISFFLGHFISTL
jgi:protein MPE1